jgi:predicted enzyme related to lactoylglutathione lyase
VASPVRWLTAFIDRPADGFDDVVEFWLAVTGTTLSPTRGEQGQFATLVPPVGDAYLRVQRTGAGTSGSHLDVHVDDLDGAAARAVEAGATEIGRDGGVIGLRSPAGLPWCVVAHHGEATVPPANEVDGQRSAVRMLCIDIPADRFDDECRFWATVVGGEVQRSVEMPEFAALRLPPGLPLGILLQRRGDADGPATAHLDLGSSDIPAVVAQHVDLGARAGDEHEHWRVMVDPAGLPYCVTAESPDP